MADRALKTSDDLGKSNNVNSLRGLLALLLLLLPTGSLAQQFSEVHERAGLAWSASDIVPEFMTVAWRDLNQDGRLDLWMSPHGINLLDTKTAPFVYFNRGNGRFERQDTGALFPRGYGDCKDLHQVSFGDYNNDGHPDIFLNAGGLSGRGTPSGRSLLRCDRTHFTPVAEELHLSPLIGSGRGGLWFDANRDGRLDLIAVNAIVNASTGRNPSQLFEQTAEGFVDRTATIGFSIDVSANFAVYSHLFGDNVPCIVLMGGEQKGDRQMQRGFLARIFRHTLPTFDDVTARFPRLPQGRDAAVADFDNDLVPDIFIVNNPFPRERYYSPASVPIAERDRNARLPTLLQYDAATMRFVDRAAHAGFTERILGATVLAGDFDNDGAVDLWIAQQYGDQLLPAIFYRNNGNGTFTKLPNANGAAYQLRADIVHAFDQQHGIAAAVGDYDGDGFLDIGTGAVARASIWDLGAAGHLNEKSYSDTIAIPPQLFHNRGNANHWLELDLIGTVSARDAIGATVIVSAGGRRQFRELNSGNHRTGQDMPRLHFGLGASATVDRIEIRWPSAIVQTLGPVPSNQILRVVEKEGSS